MIDKRKFTRRPVVHRAVIRTGDSRLIECVVQDISEGGAKLRITAEVPDTFVLFLSWAGSVSRKCEVRWRSDGAVGVSFVERKSHSSFGYPQP